MVRIQPLLALLLSKNNFQMHVKYGLAKRWKRQRRIILDPSRPTKFMMQFVTVNQASLAHTNAVYGVDSNITTLPTETLMCPLVR
jgi:hypothetical protein